MPPSADDVIVLGGSILGDNRVLEGDIPDGVPGVPGDVPEVERV